MSHKVNNQVNNQFILDFCFAWSDLTFETQLVNPGDQVVWNNSLIRVNNDIILYKNRLGPDILYVRDLYDNEGRPLNYDDFIAKYQCRDFPFIILNGLYHTIPSSWRPTVRSLSLPRQPTSQHTMLARFTAVEKICRYTYKIFNNQRLELPRGCVKWNNVFVNPMLDWGRVFSACIERLGIRE